MLATVDAVFEQGVFRPLTPVGFEEAAQVELTVGAVPAASRRFADRVVLPEFAQLQPRAGDTTRHISADRDWQR